jgi:sporulation protein YlmC with PRC-barrel domain
MKKNLSLRALAVAAVLCTAGLAAAQTAGASTTIGLSILESTQVALGWSAKKTLMGKTVYNEQDQKVGKVEDLIISPDRNVSFVIVGAGGFVGIGRHDVAIPVSQIQDHAGKLVMAGATKDTVKALPRFEYANDSTRRAHVVAVAEQDIASGKTLVADMEKKAGAAAADAKARIDTQITVLQADVKAAEARLAELKEASTLRWKQFEAGVGAATARLRKSMDSATG